MSKYKKNFLGIACFAFFAASAGNIYASAATISAYSTGNGDNVQVNVTGTPSSPVLLWFTKQNVGPSVQSLGNTDSSGAFSTIISTGTYGILAGSSVYASVSGVQSPTVTWPGTTGAGSFSLSQTGIVTSIGQTTTITANNSSGTIYLSNNSNPPIANINISGNQINITGLSNGSTTATICSAGSTVSNSPTCASAYITVGTTGTQSLSFSVSNVTVAPGQSVPITITGGTGTYTVLNNSNSGVIQAGVNGSIVTLTTNATTGTAAITICSSDMSSCGIINATAGTTSTSPITFSQSSATLSVGQSLSISINGGIPYGLTSTTYYISANTSTSTVQTSIGGSGLALTGLANGSSTITVCSAAGGCASLVATVSYASNGGPLQLSQSTVSLLTGQILSITVSGGVSPYSLTGGTGTIAQTSLNGNVINISGVSAGTSLVNVCSAGGACLTLTIIVNASGTGSQLTLSPNSVNVSVGGSASVALSGAGGYYPSNSTNPAVATVQISGSTAVVSGLTAGNNNVSICQSGGQCSILFVTVGGSTSGTPTFSQTLPSLTVGQVTNITVSGGSGGSYYISSNTNSTAVQSSLNSGTLTLTGLANGSSTIVVCSSATSCGSVSATVGSTSTTPLSFPSSTLPAPTVGQAYTTQLSTTGGTGSYSYTVSSGSLPAGTMLSSGGLISGTPTNPGWANFTVTVTDTASATASTNFSLNVAAAGTTTTTPPPATTSTAYPNGELIKENGTIYIVYQNTKVGFTNAAAFLGLGFNFKNVTTVTNSGLSVSPRVVITASGEHPRGTWVSNGKAVYFVTPTGLIPVSDWSTFITDGGQASFIVKANNYDLAAPKLPVLTVNDPRLKQ